MKEFLQQIFRRYRVFWLALGLPWLIILANPNLRGPLQKLLSGRYWNADNVPFAPSNGEVWPRSDVLEVAPHELDARFLAADALGYSSPESMRALGQLSDENPRLAWLAAHALIAMPQGDFRWDTEYTNLNFPKPPSIPSFKSQFTPDVLALGFRLARRGQQLEPQNTFFWWMEARLLFAAHRDAEAVAVLRVRSRRTDYNEHWSQALGARLRATERMRVLLPEEKIRALAGINLPYLSGFRQAMRLALWQAELLKRRGKAAQALEIESAVARLGATMALKARFLTVALSGSSFVRGVWHRHLWVLPIAARAALKSASEMERNRVYQGVYERAARRLGRRDLSVESQAHLAALQGVAGERMGKARDRFFWVGGNPQLARLSLFQMGVCIAGIQILLAALIWLASWILGPWWVPRELELPKFSARWVAWPLGAGLVVAAVCWGVAGDWLVAHWVAGAFTCGATAADDPKTLSLGLASMLAPCVLVILASGLATHLALRRLPTPTLQFSPLQLGASALWDWSAPFFSLLLVWFLRLGFVVAWVLSLWILSEPLSPNFYGYNPWLDQILGVLRWYGFPFDPMNIATATFGLTGLWLLWMFVKWRWFAPLHTRATIFAGFSLLRRGAAWAMTGASWLLLLALVSAQSPRAEIATQVAHSLNSSR